MNLKETIEQAWANREMMTYQAFQDGVRKVIEEVDKGAASCGGKKRITAGR